MSEEDISVGCRSHSRLEMEGKYLSQPVGNNECGFYVIWAMLRYIGGKSEEVDKLVCIIPISFMSVNNSTK